MSAPTFVILIVCFASMALADDFKTNDGKEYKDVTVSNPDPCSIKVTNMKAGQIVTLYFTELPKEVQERFHYDAKKCEEYSAQQNNAFEEARKQREDDMRRYEEERKRESEQYSKEQKGIEQRQNIPRLQAHLKDLQDQENDLNQRIWEAKQLLPGVTRVYRGYHKSPSYFENSNKADLPFLENQLKDLRDEKGKVTKQLEEAQRSTGK